MGKRRVNFNIGITFDTTIDQLKTCTERIKKMLFDDEEIDHENIVVTLDSIGDSSYNLMLYFYTKTTNWNKYLDAKQDVYYKIIKILDEEKVRLAIPAQAIKYESKPVDLGS
jgi:MscS family membrane protein